MSKISRSLSNWYQMQNYHFPWREKKTVYSTWISEIMLQQTQVNTASSYFKPWMKKFPSVDKVASANIDTILKLWEGLGYYQRAHNIYHTAQTIHKKYNGIFPKTYDELISFKGIGDYTASAILSIAYDQPYPAIDGNLKRVIARLYGVKDSKHIIKESKRYISILMKNHSPSIINQSLMDLGREICLPVNPKCIICPVKKYCKGFNSNLIDKFTFKKKRKKLPIHDVAVGLIFKNNKLLIAKRKNKGLLGGLWELPGGKLKNKETFEQCLEREVFEELNIKIKIINKIGFVKHYYSHFGINMYGFTCDIKSGKPKPLASDGIKWINFEQINNYAFPKATLKLFGLLNDS